MKSTLIAISALASILLPASSFAEVDPELKDAVDVAFDEDESEIAFDMILKEIQSCMAYELQGESFNEEVIDYAFGVLSNRVHTLQENTVRTNIVGFSAEAMDAASSFAASSLSFSETAFDTGLLIAGFFADHPLLLFDPNVRSNLAGKCTQIVLSQYATQVSNQVTALQFLQTSLEQQLSVPNDDKISSVLKSYDVLKGFVEKWIAMEIAQTIQRKNLRQHIQTKKKLELLKDSIIEERTKYLSYTVLSPILAETSRRFWLANQRLIGHDKDTTKTAVEYLAKRTRANWPRECSEDVRRQWFEVLKQLKEMAGKAENEEYEALAGIIKPDSDATLGGKAWWNN